MPFDGSGNFNRVMDWTNDAAANIKIRADRHDQNDDDIAAGLSNTITKDGQSQPTADIPMNGKKLTNLGAPVNPTDAATKATVDLKADKASPTFTGKVTLPTGSAASASANLPAATAAPTTPVDGDIWSSSTQGIKHRIGGVTYTYGRLEAVQTWTADQTFSSVVYVGQANANGQGTFNGPSIELGNGRTADGVAYIDFHGTTGTDFDTRLIRNGGVNGSFQITHNGTGGITITANATTINGMLVPTPTAIGAIGQSGANTGVAVAITSPNNAGAAAFLSLNRSGAYAVNFGLDTDNKLKVGGWSMGAVAYEILHTGNYATTGDTRWVLQSTAQLQKFFESAQQTVTTGGGLTIAHGLGVKPKLVWPVLVCITANNGFNVGDEVSCGPIFDAGSGGGIQVVPDATNLNVRFGNSNTLRVLNQSTGAGINLTNSQWRAVFRAWA